MSTTVGSTWPGTPTVLLRHLIELGVLRRGSVEDTAHLVRSSPDSWYAKIVSERDVEEADSELAEWTAMRGRYADSVSSAAVGLLALAALDDSGSDSDPRLKALSPFVGLVPLTDKIELPGTCDYNGGTLILGANPHISVRGSDVFGPNAGIGLQYVGIAVNRDLADPTLLLFLHHPEYHKARTHESSGYAVIAIDTEGCTSGMTVNLSLIADPVEFVLGLTSPGEAINIRANIGSQTDAGVKTALWFPGSDEYLARRIPDLGTYLENVAAALRRPHQR